MSKTPKIAIVYDWVTTREGGAEKVLLSLHQAFPQAVLYTSVANLDEARWAQSWSPQTSFLQRWPFLPTHHRWALPFLPLAFESLDVSHFDIVISVTSAFAKGVITSPDQLHICYLLTPPRFLYSHVSDYFSPLGQWLMKPFLRYLEWWDTAAAWRPDYVIALSQRVADRTQKTYQRQVDKVIYPTIVENIAATKPLNPITKPYFLVISRLVAYKRIDLAIQACQALGLQLYIIGNGPERQPLENITAKPDLIHFLGSLDDATTHWYLAHAQALIMPGVEDFGITALEAAAVGTPTILQASSGVAEILEPDQKIELTSLDLAELQTQLKKTLASNRPDKLSHQSVVKYVTTTFVREMQTTVFDQWSRQMERTS